jgi:hypothetical protein
MENGFRSVLPTSSWQKQKTKQSKQKCFFEGSHLQPLGLKLFDDFFYQVQLNNQIYEETDATSKSQ